jgi:enhancing lycopene biosynthesis protein 2
MKNIAVILSGSGFYDGAEIHESVLSLLAIKKAGANYQCFAPDIEQMHVIDHLSGQELDTPRRNVLVESARIARGEIKSLSEFDAQHFDGLLVPGGFGAAKNLSNFVEQGVECKIEPSVLAACQAIARLNKPAAYLCIAPTLMPQVYGEGVRLTIGNDPETAAAIEAMGGVHVDCLVTDSVFDEEHNVLSTPAYMLAQDIAQAAIGIENTVNKLLDIC